MTRKKGSKQTREVQAVSTGNILETYRQWMTSDEYDQLKEEVTQPLSPSIRLNPLKTIPDFNSILSQKYDWILHKTPFCDSGFRVDTGNGPGVGNTLEHRLGLYYVQETASMLPVELFNVSSQEPGLSLDMAASPGGKTTHLVSRLNDHGFVIANDSSQGRIQALRVVLQNWGAVNTAITCLPGELFGTLCPGLFDRVLLDAPCSMQGLRTAESHPVKNVSDRETRQLASRQSALLRSAIHAVRVGGEVVYSTCTLLPQEDELVVDAILKEFNGRVVLMDAQQKLPVPAPGLQNMGEEKLSPGMEQTIRLWPHRYHTAGFFACLLMKEEESSPSPVPIPKNLGNAIPRTYLSDTECRDFYNRFQDEYGFDLHGYCESEGLLLVRHYERIHLTLAILAQRFPQLKTLSAGMLLGEETPDGFLPSFEWVSRFGPKCSKNLVMLNEDQVRQWTSGKNIPLQSLGEKGRFRILLDSQHLALGCGKVIGNELKNLLPRRLIYTSSNS